MLPAKAYGTALQGHPGSHQRQIIEIISNLQNVWQCGDTFPVDFPIHIGVGWCSVKLRAAGAAQDMAEVQAGDTIAGAAAAAVRERAPSGWRVRRRAGRRVRVRTACARTSGSPHISKIMLCYITLYPIAFE